MTCRGFPKTVVARAGHRPTNGLECAGRPSPPLAVAAAEPCFGCVNARGRLPSVEAETTHDAQFTVSAANQSSAPVTFTYEALTGNVEGWTETWTRQVASD